MSGSKPITVVAVDDHYLIRQGIEKELEDCDDIVLVGKGDDGDDAFRLLEEHRPQILLLDLRMPQRKNEQDSGQFQALPAITQLFKMYPETGIIVLTMEYVPVLIEGAIQRGVRGYILKGDDLSQNLPAAIRTVHRGGVYFSETIHQQLFQGVQSGRNVGLSKRQIDILTLIGRDPNPSYLQHAMQLGITENTFKNHLTKAFKALGVKNATAAVITCMRLGLIPPP